MDLSGLSGLNRVVIIDDNPKDGFAISKALNKEGVASYFYHFQGVGFLGDIPSQPNVRLVFLDLELDPQHATDVTTKANLALNCLRKFVGKNSFYILALWSSRTEDPVREKFQNLLDTVGRDYRPCIAPITLNKNECADPASPEEYDSAKINEQLKVGLEPAKKFGLFTSWERKITGVTSSFLRSLISSDETQESVSAKIRALSFAQAGTRSNNQSLHALLTLNDSLKGTIDSALIGENYDLYNTQIIEGADIGEQTMSDINGTLTIHPDIRQMGPGIVIKTNHDYCASDLIRGGDRTTVMVDITALCDYAQGNNEFHHLVHGVLLPSSNQNKTRKQKCYLLDGAFSLEGNSYRLAVNLASVKSFSKDDYEALSGEVWFKFRDNVVIDIQQRVSSYNSRPGRVILTAHGG